MLVAAAFPGVSRYSQNVILQAHTTPTGRSLGQVDGISQFRFADLAAAERLAPVEAIAALRADEPNFVSNLIILTALQYAIVESPAQLPATKSMMFLKKRAELTPQSFSALGLAHMPRWQQDFQTSSDTDRTS